MGREEHDRAVRFRTARRDPALTVVEGFHALKHALRFGAELVEAVAVDPASLDAMAADLAPDLAGQLAELVEPVDKETLADLVPLVPHTGVVAIARRPRVDLDAALADPAPTPAILLEQPRNMG
ncbi:MAG TPA: RNA methyltransferase substrate-binding domain-containing protein, partial [Solirubrobacterales bacterium]|nr:RNA methyltransferase substrate-binding domain-containing protein [Solirubrobacterales bacterium]